MKKYCEVCKEVVDTIIVKKQETYTPFDKDVTVEAEVLTCAKCGNELFCEELDEQTLQKVIEEYGKEKEEKEC